MKGNVVYRVQVLYYEEFCGCFGDTVIFEKYYTTKDAANKKIKELNKQLEANTGNTVAFMAILIESQKNDEKIEKVNTEIHKLLDLKGGEQK